MKYGLLIALLLSLTQLTLAQQTEKRYLSGTGNSTTENWQFYCTAGQNSGKWTTIPVPSNWELQGFGKYNYGFAKDSSRGKEQGLYKYEFQVPASWKGKHINLVFEGAMTDTEVKINGKSAGQIHQGSYYAFKYDISNLLTYGSGNLLEATVSKHSSNQSVNEAERKGDFWIFGGIFRPVYLEALPAEHIANVAIDAKANGTFTAQLQLNTSGKTTDISAQIYTISGHKVGTPFRVKTGTGSQLATLTKSISNPLLWTSETPNRYKVTFSLTQNGKLIHTLTKSFGFRTVEVKQRDGIYVNGTKIKLKGVNRHSFWPSSGRALSKKLSILDVNLMKDMNMNAVRMSHYPPDDHFLDVCDSLGLFVFDELAGWHGHYDTPTGTKLLKELITHDVNHPSVIFWINGNEGGHNYELDPLFAQLDIQKRHVIHAWEDFGGFDTQHYREYNYGIGNYNHGHSITLPTEFLHGMYDGGHGAGLDDYWEAMWHDPLAAGGFLWDFADQGVVRTDRNEGKGPLDTDGNRGADGIVGPYREKEGSFFTIKEVWSPIKLAHREITPAFDGSFPIENRHYFTNVNQCSFSGKLVKVSGPYDASKPLEKAFSIVAPNLKPFEKGALKANLPTDWANYDFLYITAIDPHKRELFTWSFPISLPNKVAASLISKEGTGTVTMTETDSLYTVSANGIQLTFSRRTGLLKQVANSAGKIPFTNGPILQEGVNNFKNFTEHSDGKSVIIESTFDRKSSYNTLQWTIYPSGWVKMRVRYFPDGYFTMMDGVNFSFPESEMKAVNWMGKGPYRVWKNRMKGGALGVWNKAYNNSETGEAPFIYPEFKGYHANMYWCRFETSGQPFTVATENEDVFFRLFTPAWKTDQWHNYEPTFPSGDISFMQGISSIGTKTQRNETTGPMGMKHIFYDYEKEPARAKELTLYFDFSGK
ncbi:glycoside hydrolase family 2 [Spirosoma sp. KCTC 42546]|uniref:glycoside hydrolase family 2 TIM barrel-domain containing protein n=1 Tax=Spirosoma sp. KCTC 42546 TaxID=2520506 RepID=UPI001157DE30|nr:glycoside hydrolase family 2 TIM barrel-domain containing protein [Spirosoma sp. KCTC 42546]QDK80620.1 glycoside hydrolase family 2 [Spirosoma sp. KCTC 42546]